MQQLQIKRYSPQGPAVEPERQRSDSISLSAIAATVVGTGGPVAGTVFFAVSPAHLRHKIILSICTREVFQALGRWAKSSPAKKKRRFLPLMARFSPTMLAKRHSQPCSVCNKRGQSHTNGTKCDYDFPFIKKHLNGKAFALICLVSLPMRLVALSMGLSSLYGSFSSRYASRSSLALSL